jgi:hypothetical protein
MHFLYNRREFIIALGVAGDQLFQRGQVGEIFRMGLLHLSHERGAELIRHVKARRPF